LLLSFPASLEAFFQARSSPHPLWLLTDAQGNRCIKALRRIRAAASMRLGDQ
jgi:hypothetical protein